MAAEALIGLVCTLFNTVYFAADVHRGDIESREVLRVRQCCSKRLTSQAHQLSGGKHQLFLRLSSLYVSTIASPALARTAILTVHRFNSENKLGESCQCGHKLTRATKLCEL